MHTNKAYGLHGDGGPEVPHFDEAPIPAALCSTIAAIAGFPGTWRRNRTGPASGKVVVSPTC